jgi:hypothetical protein
MIDRKTIVVGVEPRISQETFRRVLERVGSPALSESDAGYEAVVRYRVDPAFALAIFKHESNYGKAGICALYDTKNPGNTRSSRTGVGEVILTPRGRFVKYPSWAEGWRDLAYRLTDPSYVYAARGLDTVEEIIPTWAPAADGNAPERSIEAVVEAMNEYVAMEAKRMRKAKVALTAGHRNADGGNPVEIELTGKLTKAYADAFRALGADVRVVTPDDGLGMFPGGLQDAARVVVEWARAGWVADLYLEPHTEAGPRGVFGIYPDWGSDIDVDARERVIPAMVRAISDVSGIPIRRIGDRLGVMSERQTGVGAQGYRLGIFLVTEPIRATTTRLIVEHGAHTQTDDLAILRQPGMIERIAAAGAPAALQALGFGVSDVTRALQPGEWRDEGERRVYNVGGAIRVVQGGFLAYLRHIEGLLGPNDALALIGYPLTDEVREDGQVAQYFERVVFEWHPGAWPERWDVLVRRLGADAARAAGYRGPGID